MKKTKTISKILAIVAFIAFVISAIYIGQSFGSESTEKPIVTNVQNQIQTNNTEQPLIKKDFTFDTLSFTFDLPEEVTIVMDEQMATGPYRIVTFSDGTWVQITSNFEFDDEFGSFPIDSPKEIIGEHEFYKDASNEDYVRYGIQKDNTRYTIHQKPESVIDIATFQVIKLNNFVDFNNQVSSDNFSYITEEEYTSNRQNQIVKIDTTLKKESCMILDENCFEINEGISSEVKYENYKNPSKDIDFNAGKILGVKDYRIIYYEFNINWNILHIVDLQDTEKKLSITERDSSPHYRMKDWYWTDDIVYLRYEKTSDILDNIFIKLNLENDPKADLVSEKITLDSLQNGIWGQLEGENIGGIRGDSPDQVQISESFKKVGSLSSDFDWQRQWLQGDALDLYFSNADHVDFNDFDNPKSAIFVFQNILCEEEHSYIEIFDNQYLLPMNINVPGPSQAVGGGHMIWSLWGVKDDKSAELEFQKNSPLVLSSFFNCENKAKIIKENDVVFIAYRGIKAVDDGGEIGSIVLLKIEDNKISFKNVYDFNYGWEENEYSVQKEFSFNYDSDIKNLIINEETRKSSDNWQNWESENNIIKVELF